MASIGEFAKNMVRRSKQVENRTNKLVRATALLVENTVVTSTPVQTGRARANWNVQLGTPNRGTLPKPSTPDEGATGALARAAQNTAGRKPEQPVYITNNLDYIPDLNAGTSVQAPAGFVEAAIDVAVVSINKARLFD